MSISFVKARQDCAAPNPSSNLRSAEVARQIFLAAIDAAKRDLINDLIRICGVEESKIDLAAFDGAVTDGAADMLSDVFYHLREEARAKEDARAADERRVDIADYHSRAAQ